MKKLFLIFNCFALLGVLKAQGPLFQWAKTTDAISTNGGNEGRCITHDASGNIYTTGYFTGTANFDPGLATYSLTASAWDTFILKLDAAGNFIWAKNIGAVGSITNPRGIAVDITGNVYITGYYDTIVDFDPGPGIFNLTPNGSNDVFILKLNATGNFV
ncbi:MAG: SBBP repeat-containing protein [Bacteroidetes bacterium]|nr:SBBP repeat-containing protein [Bacteroidota bacterium]